MCDNRAKPWLILTPTRHLALFTRVPTYGTAFITELMGTFHTELMGTFHTELMGTFHTELMGTFHTDGHALFALINFAARVRGSEPGVPTEIAVGELSN